MRSRSRRAKASTRRARFATPPVQLSNATTRVVIENPRCTRLHYFGEYCGLEFITTIDLPHVMEYIWDAGLAQCPEGTDELAAWARAQKTLLLENRVDRVLAERTKLDAVPKTAPGTKAKRGRLTKSIRNVDSRRHAT
jgi:hypothetical protein